MLCIEQNDEWLVGRGYLSAESISEVLGGAAEEGRTPKQSILSQDNNEEVAELQPA